MSEVGSLYNDLFNFENRWFWKKKFVKNTSYPVHKPFTHPLILQDGTEVKDVNRWILKTFNFDDNSTFLDAGCGNGQTSFLIHSEFKSNGIGISLSSNEIELAQKITKEKGLEGQLDFRENSFEDDFNQSFDFIIAIESLKHAPELELSIANLAKHLRFGGKLIIVDDLFHHQLLNTKLTDDFKDYWEVEDLYSSSDFIDAGNRNNLELIENIDFTPNIASSLITVINLKLSILKLIKIFTFTKYRKRILNVFIGGFIQDKLYAKDGLEYRGLVFKKVDNV